MWQGDREKDEKRKGKRENGKGRMEKGKWLREKGKGSWNRINGIRVR